MHRWLAGWESSQFSRVYNGGGKNKHCERRQGQTIKPLALILRNLTHRLCKIGSVWLSRKDMCEIHSSFSCTVILYLCMRMFSVTLEVTREIALVFKEKLQLERS